MSAVTDQDGSDHYSARVRAAAAPRRRRPTARDVDAGAWEPADKHPGERPGRYRGVHRPARRADRVEVARAQVWVRALRVSPTGRTLQPRRVDRSTGTGWPATTPSAGKINLLGRHAASDRSEV